MDKMDLIKVLVDNQAYDLCKLVIGKNLKWAALAASYLEQSAPALCLTFIQEYMLDPEDYPRVTIGPKKTHLTQLLKDKEFTVYNCIKILQNDFVGLACLFDCLLTMFPNETWAKKIGNFLIKNFGCLGSLVRQDLLKSVEHFSGSIYEPPDIFGPVNKECWNLPLDFEYFYVKNEDQINFSWPEEYRVGFDSEWKLSIGELKQNKPSLIQLAFSKQVYIIDIFMFTDKQALDEKLSMIFCDENIVKIGVNLKSDLKILSKFYPEMNCFKLENFKRHVDLFSLHKNYYKTEPRGLAYLSKFHTSTPICKNERFSNWESRPLRNSQMHYALMDALMSLNIYIKIEYENELTGDDFELRFNKIKKNDKNQIPFMSHDLSVIKSNENEIEPTKCKYCGLICHTVENCPYIE